MSNAYYCIYSDVGTSSSLHSLETESREMGWWLGDDYSLKLVV